LLPMRLKVSRGRTMSELVEWLRGNAAMVCRDSVRPDREVHGISCDSRRVRPDDLYVGLAGGLRHGIEFADAAAARGAAAVLSDQRSPCLPTFEVPDPRAVLGPLCSWFYAPATTPSVYGVTGTNGKTTSVHLLACALDRLTGAAGLISSVGYRIGDHSREDRMMHREFILTTPEAPELFELLAVMVDRGVTAAAVELSSHAAERHRTDGLVADAVIFTNLGHDHLDFHLDMERYFVAKASFFAPERCRRAVVNTDDPWGRTLVDRAGCSTVSFSATGRPDASWRATDVRLSDDGATFVACGPGGRRHPVRLALPGRYNVANALGVIAALDDGSDRLADAIEAMGRFRGVPGRYEHIEAGQPFSAVVDFAHNPEALDQLLREVRRRTAGRVIVVIGTAGNRDPGKRPMMGRIVSSWADLVVVTDADSLGEDRKRIRDGLLDGVRSDGSSIVLTEPDRARALATAVCAARPGDCVVVTGRGPERLLYQGGEPSPFDDRVELRRAIGRYVEPATLRMEGS
jgi:UDP-N-acetylmuramoyl-L-alanyl-D-glutamate--2,6-diaminopimelate ligase